MVIENNVMLVTIITQNLQTNFNFSLAQYLYPATNRITENAPPPGFDLILIKKKIGSLLT